MNGADSRRFPPVPGGLENWESEHWRGFRAYFVLNSPPPSPSPSTACSNSYTQEIANPALPRLVVCVYGRELGSPTSRRARAGAALPVLSRSGNRGNRGNDLLRSTRARATCARVSNRTPKKPVTFLREAASNLTPEKDAQSAGFARARKAGRKGFCDQYAHTREAASLTPWNATFATPVLRFDLLTPCGTTQPAKNYTSADRPSAKQRAAMRIGEQQRSLSAAPSLKVA